MYARRVRRYSKRKVCKVTTSLQRHRTSPAAGFPTICVPAGTLPTATPNGRSTHIDHASFNAPCPYSVHGSGLWYHYITPYRFCHGLVAATGYSDLYFPYQTADSSFSISDLISSPLPIVVARYFFTLLVPSPSFLPLPSPSRTFHSRLPYVSLPSGLFSMLPICFG